MQTSFPDLMKQVHETVESVLRDKHRNSPGGGGAPGLPPHLREGGQNLIPDCTAIRNL